MKQLLTFAITAPLAVAVIVLVALGMVVAVIWEECSGRADVAPEQWLGGEW